MTKIILKSGIYYEPDENFINELSKLYPKINIKTELDKIAAWNLSNDKKRKTRRGIKRHINTWLSKANGNAPTLHIPPADNGYDKMVEGFDILVKDGEEKFAEFCKATKMPLGDIEAVRFKHSGQYDITSLARGIG